MEKILLSKRIKVYGDEFLLQLRECRTLAGGKFWHLFQVYGKDRYPFGNCEQPQGLPYETIDEALDGFERVSGVKLTEQLRGFITG